MTETLPIAPTSLITAPHEFSTGFHTVPSFDPVELLPPAAAERLRQLRQRSSDAHAVCVSHSEIQQASTEKIEAEARLRQLQGHPQSFGHNLPPTDPRVVAQQRLVNKLTDDLRRLNERAEARAEQWRSASQALANVESWLRDGGRPGGTVLQDFEGPEPELLKSESILDAVSRLRRRGRELRADLARVAAAPMLSSYAKRKMREQIERLAQIGTPDVSMLVEHDRDIGFQTRRLSSQVISGEQRGIAFTETPDVLALICWLHKDALIAALDREIVAEADDAAALTHEARQHRTAEVMGDLLSVEREESALVWRAQGEGLPCEHRADIDVCALLSVRLLTRAAPVSSPGTSPELAIEFLRPGR